MCLIPGPYLGEIASVKQMRAQYEKRPNRDIKKKIFKNNEISGQIQFNQYNRSSKENKTTIRKGIFL